MDKINFQNLPTTTTPLNSTNMNLLQTNVENVFNGVVPTGDMKLGNVKCKNMTGGWFVGGVGAETGEDNTSSSNRRTDYISVDFTNVTRYRLSGMPGTNGSIFVAAYNSNKQFLGRTPASVRTSTTATTLSSNGFSNGTPAGTGDIKYLKICVYGVIEGVDIDNLTPNIQLEEGNTTTSSVPFRNYGFVSGSNDKGNYVKYDDGTLICWNRIEVESIPITTAQGSLYVSSNLTSFGNFPISFVTRPVITINCDSDNNSRYVWVIKSNRPTTTEINGFRIMSGTSATLTNAYLSYMAIGRWK